MKRFTCLFLFFISLIAKAQTDTVHHPGCHLRISLLTCSPGTELYSTFGHSALRVVDSSNGTDLIFNYGTFDFDDPDFYKKFIRGKLLYFVSVDTFTYFIQEYQDEKRGIIEQTLDLSCREKQQLLAALYENAKEENKYYKYDFTYDNCTTRLRDMIARYCMNPLVTKNILPHTGVTFRSLIHEYLDKGGQYWSKLGIDILLGSPLDKKISNKEAMFLPDYLLKGFDSSYTGNKPLVADKTTILTPGLQTNGRNILTPVLIFGILFLLIAVLGFIKSNAIKLFFSIFDFAFFFLCGAIGILLLFMWFGTDHITCHNNFNLLWALPAHLPMSVLLNKKAGWIKNYFRFSFWLSMALILCWFFLPQQMNNALLFIAGIIMIRSFFLSKKSPV
jgi:Domain of unknown function (DUF4105)